MNSFPHEYLITAQDVFSLSDNVKDEFVSYDPELLYVECRACGRPVIWETGKTTSLLAEASVNLSWLDSQCLLLTETCPACHPEVLAIKIQVVRLAVTTDQDLALLQIGRGRA